MKKTDVKLVGLVTAGVLLAGVLMNHFGNGALNAAAAGYKN